MITTDKPGVISFNATAPVSPVRSDVMLIVRLLVTTPLLIVWNNPFGLVNDVNVWPVPTSTEPPKGVPASVIVKTAVFGVPSVAPPVGLDRARFTVSLPSKRHLRRVLL